jgi:hypothetical protein
MMNSELRRQLVCTSLASVHLPAASVCYERMDHIVTMQSGDGYEYQPIFRPFERDLEVAYLFV